MNDLVIKTTLPTIKGNFDIVKQQLVDGLAQYDVIITEDTVKDGKAMAADINRIKKAIKDQQAKALEDILGPVGDFKDKIKELMDLADDAREKITSQVAVYEEKRKKEIELTIRAYADERIAEAQLRPPYNTIMVADLFKLTALTKKGAPTSATINAITAKIAERQNEQRAEDDRLREEERVREEDRNRIREEERIKAEVKAKADLAKQPETPQMDAEQKQPEPEQYIPPEYEAPEGLTHDTRPQYIPERSEPATDDGVPHYPPHGYPDHYPDGDVTPQQAQPMTNVVTVSVNIEVDISNIPNITNEQLGRALQKRFANAGINNANIIDFYR